MTRPLVPEDLSRRGSAAEFNHLVWTLLNSKDLVHAAHTAASDRLAPPRVVEVLKTLVSAGGLRDGSWAATLGGQTIISAYVESLASVSFFDRALVDNSFVVVPPRTLVGITTSAALGSVVNEAEVKPLSELIVNFDHRDYRAAIAKVVNL